MKKIESLKKLLVIAENNEFAAGKYCVDGKNCVIGHLLKMDNITDVMLMEIDEGKYNNWYSIYSLIDVAKENNIENDIIIKALNNLGFDTNSEADLVMLDKLQKANDNGDSITEYLNELISELEAN